MNEAELNAALRQKWLETSGPAQPPTRALKKRLAIFGSKNRLSSKVR